MKKIGAVLAMLTLNVIGACKTQPDNLLLGKWKLISGDQACDTSMDFAAKQGSFVDYQGQTRSMAVTYVAANQDQIPTTVYVITDAGFSNHTTWNFSDKNTVKLDSIGFCTYQRV